MSVSFKHLKHRGNRHETTSPDAKGAGSKKSLVAAVLRLKDIPRMTTPGETLKGAEGEAETLRQKDRCLTKPWKAPPWAGAEDAIRKLAENLSGHQTGARALVRLCPCFALGLKGEP